MNREFYSSTRPCPYDCKYCFSRWNNYVAQQSFESELIDKEYSVIYPYCDGDFLDDKSFLNSIKELSYHIPKHTIISLSTKSTIAEDIIQAVVKCNNKLISEKQGFIKISVSITNRSMINEIEPLTCSFEDRLITLEKLVNNNIPTSVIIKPILPFIDISEYKQIIELASKYTDLFLLGDLYISEDTDFFKKYIRERYIIDEKIIEWLDSKPLWKVVECSELKNNIKNIIKDNNLLCFEKDSELLSVYIKRLGII